MSKLIKRFNWRFIIGSFLLITVFGLSWASFKWSSYTHLNMLDEIEIQGANIISEKEYFDTISSLIGISITEIDTREVGLLLESHPFVHAARVSKNYPNKLIIEIAERQPIALLNMKPILFVDNEGVVLPDLGNVDDQIIPIMSGFNSALELYPIGHQTVSVKVLESVSTIDQIIKLYPRLYDNLSEITLNVNDEFVLILSDYPTKIILGKERILEKIQILNSFEKALPVNNRLDHFNLLDLRYKRQVIARVRA